MQSIKVFLLLSASVCLVLADDLSSSSFAYGVNDPSTGDVKDQAETRIGDSVSGYYRTLDADGLLRTVNYKADDFTGFNADVKREPINEAPAPVVALAPAPEPAAVPTIALEAAAAPAPSYPIVERIAANDAPAPVAAAAPAPYYPYSPAFAAPAPYSYAPYGYPQLYPVAKAAPYSYGYSQFYPTAAPYAQFYPAVKAAVAPASSYLYASAAPAPYVVYSPASANGPYFQYYKK